MTLGTTQCAHLGCMRKRLTSANGRVVYAFCAEHLARYQTAAFAA